MDEITRDNCHAVLSRFCEENNIEAEQVAEAIGCPKASIIRIMTQQTLPSDEMLKEVGIMATLGIERYTSLSDAEREKLSESLGTVGGGVVGLGSVVAAVSALGTVGGLSGAGITSGLAALGSLGSLLTLGVVSPMVAGIAVAGALPVAFGGLGYLVVRTVSDKAKGMKLRQTDIDEHWEQLID